jgi:hypothetical protein
VRNFIDNGGRFRPMQIGIAGHQERQGIDWDWVGRVLLDELAALRDVTMALSSLAVGSDHIFARTALSLGIPVMAVIPMDGYERFFATEARAEYEAILKRCEVTNLKWTGDDYEGFFAAGKFIVENSDLLFAVWDGEPSRGLGGTADVVAFALSRSKRIVHVEPIARRVLLMGNENNG